MIPAFAPRGPVTYDENEGEINRVRAELQDAMARRDYDAAERWRGELAYALRVRDYLQRQANRRDKFAELRRLEQQRQGEEEDLKAALHGRLEALLAAYGRRLAEMERRHEAELARVDRRFGDPRYGALRESPALACLLRAEAFYSGQADFEVARAFKAQAAARTDAEIGAADAAAAAQAQGAVGLLVRRHARERRAFRDRLESEKNRLNREAANALLVLRNKYGKLRRRELGVDDLDPLPEGARREGRGVYRALQDAFSPMLGAAEALAYAADDAGAPASARNRRVRRALELALSARGDGDATL